MKLGIAANRLSTINVRSPLCNFCCFIRKNFHIRKVPLKETFKEGKSSNLGFKKANLILRWIWGLWYDIAWLLNGDFADWLMILAGDKNKWIKSWTPKVEDPKEIRVRR